MKDMYKKIEYNGAEYMLVFNLNVIEQIQEEYGTMQKWSELVEPEGENAEPNIKALKFGVWAMINEGIDIMNEGREEKQGMMSVKQVGRMITDIGLGNAQTVVTEAVIESTQSQEKNA